MKAILLAAGSGKRLGDLTKDLPKALVDINSKSLLERQIIALRKNSINDILVVTGPNKAKFKIKYIKQRVYTVNVLSLHVAKYLVLL